MPVDKTNPAKASALAGFNVASRKLSGFFHFLSSKFIHFADNV